MSKNVKDSQINDTTIEAMNSSFEAEGLAKRIEKGQIDEMENPSKFISDLAVAIGNLAFLQRMIATYAEIQERDRKIAALMNKK